MGALQGLAEPSSQSLRVAEDGGLSPVDLCICD